jgi:N-acetylmuramoyl-L-alanine amidase
MAKQPLFDAFKRNIVIDPGHGGQEAGSRGSDGTLEKAVVLRLAQIIAAELERDYKVTLTRTGDYQIDIVSRAALANHLKADLFLSIHTGGSFLHSTTGTTIYYHQRESYPPTPSVQNSDAQKDNKNSPILWHRVQERYKEKSRALALILSKRLSNLKTVKSSRIQGVPLALLQSIDMPAVMIEIGYLTNPIDEKNLQKERVLMDMAVEISNGIEDFFAQEQQ